MTGLPAALAAWFGDQGWDPLPHQSATWAAYREGHSGLLHAPTGSGKTLALWLGPVADWLDDPVTLDDGEAPPWLLWVTPLRALAADTVRALRAPVDDLPFRVEHRTSDTSSSVKARQKRRLPSALVTTPESLHLLLSYPTTRRQLGHLRAVVVDEWHELVASKRGTLAMLALERLRTYRPGLVTWGASATVGNLEHAAQALVGVGRTPVLVHGPDRQAPRIDPVVPDEPGRFPWRGHYGTTLAEPVARHIDGAQTALVFVNTRAQAERWYQALLGVRRDWAGRLAVHHGSLARDSRRFVEAGLADGSLRCVVATSTLDLGVDFPPVDLVVQVGSTKGVGRLLQRAGRSGHRPGAASRIVLVPTHAFELLEVAAVRHALDLDAVEPRTVVEAPPDVLAQYLVTVAAGDGFNADRLFDEVRRTVPYQHLPRETFDEVLDFLTSGHVGETALYADDRYQRLVFFEGNAAVPEAQYLAASDDVVNAHRRSVGVIVSDGEVTVKYARGQRVGTVPESFLARLSPGDVFLIGGKAVQLKRVRDMEAYVKRAPNRSAAVPRYAGGLLPISPLVADAVRHVLGQLADGTAPDLPEIRALGPLLDVQRAWSALPAPGQLLAERTATREGHHLFVYPFAGRLAHEGLAALLARRLADDHARTFSLAASEFGLELLSADPVPLDADALRHALRPENVLPDLERAVNAAELAKRQFREIARVAGFVYSGPASVSARALQANAGLIYDVLRQHAPHSVFLDQARRQALDDGLHVARIRTALESAARADILLVDTPKPTPFAFPVVANRLREKVSSEKVADRLQRLAAQLGRAADRGR